MAKKALAKFEAYRPKQDEVPVGSDVLTIKTATLDQEARFLALLDGLDIGQLLEAVTALVPDENDPEGGGILKVASVGPQVWEVARKVLGRQFAPAVRDGSLIMLDTRTNLDLLMKAGVIEEDDGETGVDGEYLGSKSVRLFIKSNITLLQGVNIVKAAWSMNGYGDLVGNLIPLQTEG
tara:strand:+ start:27540 stop:28076 length:537 start_codon:yes stop_codon:yes gene_type:complete